MSKSTRSKCRLPRRLGQREWTDSSGAPAERALTRRGHARVDARIGAGNPAGSLLYHALRCAGESWTSIISGVSFATAFDEDAIEPTMQRSLEGGDGSNRSRCKWTGEPLSGIDGDDPLHLCYARTPLSRQGTSENESEALALDAVAGLRDLAAAKAAPTNRGRVELERRGSVAAAAAAAAAAARAIPKRKVACAMIRVELKWRAPPPKCRPRVSSFAAAHQSRIECGQSEFAAQHSSQLTAQLSHDKRKRTGTSAELGSADD
ncbi:hypothetical protein L1887_47045 [Cichorium endivia]|nr:hypothetical protein L1887_47045 [Cichorium endivia]